MVTTEVRKELDAIMRSEGIVKAQLARDMGMERQTLNNILSKERFVSVQLVNVCEAMGYDIELNFVRRHD